MTELPEILSLIDKYGLSLLLLLVLLWWINKALDKLVGFIAPIFTRVLDVALNRTPPDTYEVQKRKILKTVFDIDSKITDLLEELLRNTKADRAYLCKYHNGGKSIDGLDYMRCSNTHEICAKGVRPQIQYLQGLPVGMFTLWNKKIVKKEQIIVEDVEKLGDTDPVAYAMLKDQNIRSIYVYGLYDVHDLPVGFLGLDYVRRPCSLEKFIVSSSQVYLRSCADKISTLLTLHGETMG